MYGSSPRPMTDAEVVRRLRRNPLFRGVMSYEALPDRAMKNLPAAIVVNTDKIGGPGLHWVVVCLFPDRSEMFDSLGRSPSAYPDRIKDFLVARGTPYAFSTRRIQGSDPVCGHYCVDFINAKARGVSMEDYLKDYGDNLILNDVKVMSRM